MRAVCTLLLLSVFAGCFRPVVAQDAVAADTTAVPFIWEHPATLVTTSGLLLAGTSTLFFEPAIRQNELTRERMQSWRRDRFDSAPFRIDNTIQYLPLMAVEGLDLLGVPSRHSGWPLLHRTATTALMVGIVTNSLKYSIREMRPDTSAPNSFPSGHTTLAFSGAELLRLEYSNTTWVIPAVGFTVATATGVLRIYNDRHWLGDVLAGAALGMLSADLSCWLNDKLETLFAPRKNHSR